MKRYLYKSATTYGKLLFGLALSLVLAAGAGAQGGGLQAILMGVESQAFPQVTATLAVLDQNGPVEGLDAAEFQIFENQAPVPASTITVEPETLQDLRLVLALDVSIPDQQAFVGMKEAAKSLVRSLGPRDRVALLSFANKATLVHDFTNNTQELEAFIDKLGSEISYTASHQALIEAVALLNKQSSGRKAVIMITDSRDNTGAAPAIDQTIDQARTNGLPLYIIGFSNKIQRDPLADKVGLTGGRYLALSQADQLQKTLQDLETLLRQGYKITFLSSLKADDSEHDLAIQIENQGRVGRVEGRFIATANDLVITLPNLNEGQTIANDVELVAEVNRQEGVSVEYLLDDKPLAEVTTPPYTFAWDSSTTQPGPHTLTVKATDSVGNTGERIIEFNIARPPSVSFPLAQTEVELGQDIFIIPRVEVDQNSRSLKIDFLIDDILVGVVDAPPYRFTLDSGGYLEGLHTIAVQVEDGFGQTAEASFTSEFVPPLSQVSWPEYIRRRLGVEKPRFARWLVWGEQLLVVVIALGTLLAGFVAAMLFLRAIARAHQERSRVRRLLQLANIGNTPSHYQLRVEETMGLFKFQFVLNGANLAQPAPLAQIRRAKTQPLAAPSHEVVAPAMSARPAPPAASQPAAGVKKGPGEPSAGRQAFQQAKAGVGQAQGCLMLFASMLNTLAELLPNPARSTVLSMARQIAAKEAAARQVTFNTQRVTGAASRLQRQAGSVVPAGVKNAAGGAAKEARPGANTDAAGVTVDEGRAKTDIIGYPTQAASDRAPTDIIGRQIKAAPPPGTAAQTQAGEPELALGNGQLTAGLWVETPPVAPGDVLNLDLFIDPANPYRKQTCAFTIHSRSIEAGGEVTPASDPATVQLKGVSWFWRIPPIVVTALFLIVLTLGVVYLTIWRLTGLDIFTWLTWL